MTEQFDAIVVFHEPVVIYADVVAVNIWHRLHVHIYAVFEVMMHGVVLNDHIAAIHHLYALQHIALDLAVSDLSVCNVLEEHTIARLVATFGDTAVINYAVAYHKRYVRVLYTDAITCAISYSQAFQIIDAVTFCKIWMTHKLAVATNYDDIPDLITLFFFVVVLI